MKYLLEKALKKVIIMEVYLKSSWRRKVHLNKRRRNLGRRFFTAQKAPVANIWGPINVMNYLKRLSHRCKIVRILLPQQQQHYLILYPFRGWIRGLIEHRVHYLYFFRQITTFIKLLLAFGFWTSDPFFNRFY